MKRQKNVPVELVRHLKTKEEKEEFVQQIIQAMPVLRIYMEAIERRIEKQEIIKADDYESPAWSHKQADRNGYNRALHELLQLFPRPEGE